MVRALDFYSGGLGSNPIRDVGFFQIMHHFLVTNFQIRKMGAHLKRTIVSFSHKNDIIVIINDDFLEMGVCYVPLHHSFIEDYLQWLEGRLAGHMMRSFYK